MRAARQAFSASSSVKVLRLAVTVPIAPAVTALDVGHLNMGSVRKHAAEEGRASARAPYRTSEAVAHQLREQSAMVNVRVGENDT